MPSEKYVDLKGLSEETGLPIRTLRTFVSSRKIPYIKASHNLRFLPSKVRSALEKFEVKAIGLN